jgi:hypothetical protein
MRYMLSERQPNGETRSMTALAARLVEKPWALPLAMVVIVGAFVAAMQIWPPPVETRTVVKVCRSGVLVLRDHDGSFRVLRPNATATWPATGPEVCQ